MTKTKLLFISIVLGFSATLIHFYLQHQERVVNSFIHIKPLWQNYFVSEQIDIQNFDTIKAHHIQMIIDLRPDGEVRHQPTSYTLSQAATQLGIKFFYIPIPHGKIDSTSVNKLNTALKQSNGPTLLFCRSGNRAARTFALALASNPQGPDLITILQIVKSTGHSAADLKTELTTRIAQRNPPQGLSK